MKKIFLFTCAFFSLSILSQSGKVNYSVFIETPKVEIPLNIRDQILSYYKEARNQKFELVFNDNECNFYFINNQTNNDNNTIKLNNIVRTGFTCDFDFYYNSLKKNELWKMNDGTLITNPNTEKKWEITKDTKKISNYTCYKAIQKTLFKTRKGESKTKEIIAWFAPALPYSFGPVNHYGLPGLILELTENKTTYIATKIEPSKKKIIIKFPTGKTITKEEYDKKLKSQMGM